MGEPGASPPATHREQVSAVYRRRHQAVEAGAVSAKSPGIERGGNCRTAAAGRAGASCGGRWRWSDWVALAAVAGETTAVPGAGGASSGHFGGILERARAVADERVGGNAPQAGAVL